MNHNPAVHHEHQESQRSLLEQEVILGNVEHEHAISMTMVFHGGYTETILFSFWQIDSLAGLVVAMVALLVLSAVLELVKLAKSKLSDRDLVESDR